MAERTRANSTIATLVRGTIMFALSKGVAMERITAETGITPEELFSDQYWLPQEALPGVWRLLAADYPGQALSIEMANAAPPDVIGLPAVAQRFAPDLGTVLRTLIRYRMLMSEHLNLELYEVGDDEVHFHVSHPMDALSEGRTAELGLALAARLPRTMGEDDADLLIRAEFSHSPHGPIEAYRGFFQVPVLFGRPRNLIVYAREAMDRPNQFYDPGLHAYFRGQLEALEKRHDAEAGSLELKRVRQAILHNAARSEYGAPALAKRLGMSERTLQRVARAHGCSVREMLDEVRQRDARHLLADPRLSIEEVAVLLGYSSDRAFRRAFKRWTGETPAQVRKQSAVAS